MSILNISWPTKAQWSNILMACGFSFVSAFLFAFTAGGGLQSDLAATISLVLGAGVSAFNTTLYFLYITFFQKPKE